MFAKLKEIFSRRELLYNLVIRDLKIKYRYATGGLGWMLVMPLVQVFVFSFVFRFLFKIKMENYPVFLLSGLFAWSFLASCLDGAVNSLSGNANLIKKTYFPREILPMYINIVNLVTFVFSLVILIIFSVSSKISLFPAIFWSPLVIFIQIILTIGISLFVAGLNTIYRDTQFIMNILLFVWFYITPIVYPSEMIKGLINKNLFSLYSLNPMFGIISGYQQIFAHGRIPDLGALFNGALFSITIFIAGLFYFSKHENIFADLV